MNQATRKGITLSAKALHLLKQWFTEVKTNENLITLFIFNPPLFMFECKDNFSSFEFKFLRMKTLFTFCLFIFLGFQSYGQVNIDVNNEKEVMSYLVAHKFKSEAEGDYPMYLEIEQLNNQPTLVLSNDHGKRKLFTNLTFQPATGYGLVTG